MKTTILLLSLMTISTSIFAKDASQFCAPQAATAAQALASTNGSISTVESSTSKDGKVFTIVLSEEGIGRDTYTVTTSGGHDCLNYSVKVLNPPTILL